MNCLLYVGYTYIGKVNIKKVDKNLIFNNKVLNFSNITGIKQLYKYNKDQAEVIIETKTPFIITDLKQKLLIPSNNYIRIYINNQTLIDIFGKDYDEIDTLPNWSKRIPFLKPVYRKIIQNIIIMIEICLCIWTLYQIFYNTPGFWFFFDNVIAPILSPVINIWNRIGSYIKIIFQIQILSYIRYEQIIQLWNMIFYPMYRLIYPIFRFIIPIAKNTSESIPLYKKIYYNIKNFILLIWEYLIKPIKNLYILINTSRSGELGRKVKTEYNKPKK